MSLLPFPHLRMMHSTVYTLWARRFNSGGPIGCCTFAWSPPPPLLTLSTHKHALDAHTFMLAPPTPHTHSNTHARARFTALLSLMPLIKTGGAGQRGGGEKKFEAVKANPQHGITREVTTDGDCVPRPHWIWHREREWHELPPLWGRGILLRTRLHIECFASHLLTVLESAKLWS